MEPESGNNAAEALTPFPHILTLDKPPEDSSLQRLLERQRHTIYQQIEELQRLVVMECRMTGANPLSDEMAAAVMGINGVGERKRYGESLTPRALKYLFNVFSIKDTITKNEACEISGLCGATVMQVREFFTLQRSRVRRLMHKLHEAPADHHIHQASEEMLKENPCSVNPCTELGAVLDQLQESMQADLKQRINSDHNNSKTLDIAETLINLMQKENTFSGQSQLAQFIMQARQGPVLQCFISKGGLSLLSRWIIQAAVEEQTSLLRILLKTLAKLPLGSALPRQMSSLVQIVNKLRFYRAQGVASRARLLLSRWSKFLRSGMGGRISAPTCPSGTSQLQKRNREHDELNVKLDVVNRGVKTSYSREVGSDAGLCSATVETENASRSVVENATHGNPKKKIAHALLLEDRIKERRKVRLFEESRIAVKRAKDIDVRPSSSGMVSRPLSADDIQKAKRKAYLLQSFSASKSQKTLTAFKQQPSNSTQTHTILNVECSIPNPNSQELLEKETTVSEELNTTVGSETFLAHKKAMSIEVTLQADNTEENGLRDGELQDINAACRRILNEDETVSEAVLTQNFTERCCAMKSTLASDASNAIMLNKIHKSGNVDATMHESEARVFPWRIPPRVILDPRWSVAGGEDSAERITQSIRLNNEQEAIYLDFNSIPTNPGEPLERFSLFDDDSNVPEILLEAVPEDSQERISPVASDHSGEHTSVTEEETEDKSIVLSEATIEEVKNSCGISIVAGITSTEPEKTPTEASSDVKDSSCNQAEQENVATSLKLTLTSEDTIQSGDHHSDKKSARLEPGKVMHMTTHDPDKSARVEPDKLIPSTPQELKSDATLGYLSKIGRVQSTNNKDQSRLASSSMQTHRKSSQHKHSRPIIGGMEKGSEKASILSDKVKVPVNSEQESNKRRMCVENERNTIQNKNYSSLRKEKANLSSKFDNSRSSHVEKKEKSNTHHSKKAPSSSERMPYLLQKAKISGALPSHVDTSSTQSKGGGTTVKQLNLASKLDLDASTSSDKMNRNSNEMNKHESPLPLGINLATLSKEACFEMLRVVLQQLANSSGDSGADLELLAVFLKNPDLVYALTSAQSALPGKELVALTELLKGNSERNMSTSTISKAGLFGGSNLPETSQDKSAGIQGKASAVPSMSHSSLVVSLNSTANSLPQSLSVGQLATPHARTSMASIEQTQSRHVQPAFNAITSGRPQFSKQSIFHAADRVLPNTMDIEKEEIVRGHPQQSVGLLPPPNSVQNMGFLPIFPRPVEIDGPAGRKPSFETAQPPVCNTFSALVPATLSSYNGFSSSSLAEIAGFRPSAQLAEAKGPLIAASPDQMGTFPSQAQQVGLDNSRGKCIVPFISGPNSSVSGNSMSRDQGLIMISSRAANTTIKDSQQPLIGLKEAHPRSDPLWRADSRSQPLLPFPGSMQPQGQSSQVFEQTIRPVISLRPPLPPGRPPAKPLSSRQPPAAPIIPATPGDMRWHHSAIHPDGGSHPRPSWRT